jgi:hypothetical protein
VHYQIIKVFGHADLARKVYSFGMIWGIMITNKGTPGMLLTEPKSSIVWTKLFLGPLLHDI